MSEFCQKLSSLKKANINFIRYFKYESYVQNIKQINYL